ncbi:TonB-dependent receptor [Flavobacterium macrobrachii]|uniref:TonB-dependent receptor n=1 Tax=Flavobacterium macrobrachii TaxID=591204 RepID=UPI003F718F41
MNEKKNQILFFLFFFTILSYAQEKFTFSGTISDLSNKETLIGVNIYIVEANAGVSTNEYGFFSITLPKGNYTAIISYIGYQKNEQTINLNQNIKINISLSDDSQTLDEVVVSVNRKKSEIRKPEMSVAKISIQTVKQMPVVLGELDILKSITTLPGVTNAGEGQSGFNVRGGSADQNLILLDEATIYNASHLFGFFSVFNADAIKDLKLYKGGIPSKFGGRLSSVLDVYQKEGNKNDFKMNGGIGLISSRLLAEGPINKGKGSFLVAGRGSYAHLFLKLANNKNSAYFYDVNGKFSYKFNDKNNVYVSGYYGKDLFNLGGSFVNTYGNTTANVRWNHLFSDNLFSNLSIIYSNYFYGLTINSIGLKWDSGIQNINLKYDFKHYLSDKFKLGYGANAQYYDFNPGKLTPSGINSSINEDQLDKKYAFEPAFYIDIEQKISSNLSLNYGLRYSMFYRLGEQTLNVYENNQAVVWNNLFQIYEKADPIGTRFYERNEVIASFDNFEPRISISYSLDDNQSIKVSYNRMAQYLHLISNTQSPTPLDVWAPSDNFLKPQTLDQVALGYFRNLYEDKYSLEVETFYKKIGNRLDYIDGADLVANNAIEQVVLNGKARAYGLEVLFKKNEGKFNGWIAYTLSRTEQQTPGRTSEENGINNGKWYKTGWDKTHNLSITSLYDLNDKWKFGSIFTFQTGQPVTFPNGQYQYQGITVPSFNERNEDNLPAYHRLDVSATYTPKPDKKKGWQSEWVFSIYNVYSRRNAASISFRQNEETGRNEALRLSIFGIVPGVTYNFKF